MELDGLRVVHAGLDRAADELMIDARVQRLDEDLQPLRTAWIGDAQQAYAAAKQRWDSAITEMRDLLAQTSRQVGVANAAYRAADVRGARSFDA
jgi:early secretory antigenic target protein ESAT-6